MSNISITIVESEGQITKSILKALLPEITTYFQKAFDRCESQINALVSQAIINSPEYQSLLSGKLKYEFGLPDADSRLSNILNIIQQNVRIKYNAPKISKDEIRASFSLFMISSDYEDLLASSVAIFTTEKGSQLEWLKWLLLFGDQTIIKEYNVKIGPSPFSRTGNAIMVGQAKGRWSVPPEFAGSKNNNWITRAIDSVSSDIEKLLTDSLKV